MKEHKVTIEVKKYMSNKYVVSLLFLFYFPQTGEISYLPL